MGSARGSYKTGSLSVPTGQGSATTSGGVCAPFPQQFLTDGASFKTGAASVRTSASPPACTIQVGTISSAVCRQTLPVTPTTVGLWTGDGTLADSSGHGNDLAISIGSENYAEFPGDTCSLAIRLDDGAPGPGGHNQQSALIAPSSAALRLRGELTMNATLIVYKTISQSIFACLNAAASSVLYDSFFHGATEDINWFDNTGGPRPFAPPVPWFTYAINQTPLQMTWRRQDVGGGIYRTTLFLFGVAVGAVTGTLQPTTGDERLTIGGFAGDGFASRMAALIKNIRLENGADTDDQILADAQLAMGARTLVLVNCADLANFTAGQTYVTRDGAGNLDPGSFTVDTINTGDCSFQFTANGGWTLVAGHTIWTV